MISDFEINVKKRMGQGAKIKEILNFEGITDCALNLEKMCYNKLGFLCTKGNRSLPIITIRT
jgi:hypothetical protein